MPRTTDPRGWTRAAALLAAALIAAVASAADEPAAEPAADLELLGSWLSGSFTTSAETAATGDPVPVDLHLVPIWVDRPDGPWRYLEQALSGSPERPYRQRVLELGELADDLLEVRIWALADPGAAVGAWRDDEPLATLSPADLVPRPGCSILLRRRGEVFEGSTVGFLCESELRGATVATSEVAITADGLVSWDRGWDTDGNQVWGATDGGLVFDRVVPSPAPEAASDPGEAPGDSGGGSGSDSGRARDTPSPADDPTRTGGA